MKKLLLLLFVAGALPFAALAQQALTGTITGTVLDSSSAAVPGAQVTAVNKATGLERSATSGDLGLYKLAALPVGDYDVTAKAQGFTETKVEGVRVGVGQQLTLELKLAVGTVAQTVSVEAQAAAIETTRASQATSVSSGQISNLGINGRDFLNFALLTPGVSRDQRGGDLSFGGQRGTLNNLQVDGADNNNSFFGQAAGRTGTNRAPYQFSVDSVEEFQVNSNSFAAEFGKSGGAVINVVTKSGTNGFHGSGFWFFRDRLMNANTSFLNSVPRDRQPFHVNQFGATVGGPVVKNKDFFFFNYDGQRRLLPNAVIPGVRIPDNLVSRLAPLLTPYTLGFNQDVYMVKNDWQMNDKHRLSVRYNAQRFTGQGVESNGSTVAREHSGDQKVNTDTVSTSLTSILSSKWLNEFRFQLLRDNEPSIAYSAGVETVLQEGGSTVLSFGSSSITPRFANIKGYQFQDNLTYARGRNTWKAGFDTNINRIENFFAGNVRGSYTFPSFASFLAGQPSRFVQAFAGEGTLGLLTKPNFTDLGFYVQDEFRMTSKLTLNAGLRYDTSFWTQPPIKNPDAQLAAFGLDTSRLSNDYNNFGPRFGFAYRPLNNNKLVVRGGYGAFFGRTPQILMSTAFNQNGISVSTLTFTQNLPTYPNNFSAKPTGVAGAPPSIWVFAKDYVSPVVFQGSFGLEYEVLPNTTIGVSYLNVRGEHLSRTRDVNLFPPVAVTANLRSADLQPLGTRTLLRYPATRPMTNFARVSLFDSGADSFYNGFTFTLRRRFSTRYSVNFAYTYSKVIDTLPDFTSVTVGSIDDPKNPQYGTIPGLDRGPGGMDQRHRAVTNFVWDLDYFRSLKNPAARYLVGGWSLSGIITAQTGQPFSNGVGGDANNDGTTFNDRVPGDGRNTNYGPTIAIWDFRVTKSIPIRELFKINIALDAFNMLNQANFVAGDIRNGRYNFALVSGAPTFTARTDFGTHSGQFLSNNGGNRVLQVSAKIVF